MEKKPLLSFTESASKQGHLHNIAKFIKMLHSACQRAEFPSGLKPSQSAGQEVVAPLAKIAFPGKFLIQQRFSGT